MGQLGSVKVYKQAPKRYNCTIDCRVSVELTYNIVARMARSSTVCMVLLRVNCSILKTKLICCMKTRSSTTKSKNIHVLNLELYRISDVLLQMQSQKLNRMREHHNKHQFSKSIKQSRLDQLLSKSLKKIFAQCIIKGEIHHYRPFSNIVEALYHLSHVSGHFEKHIESDYMSR